MLKSRGAVTENILILKYQKQAIAAALSGEYAYMLLPTCLTKSWKYQVLPFIVNRGTSPIGNKVPDREFYWSVNLEFYSRL